MVFVLQGTLKLAQVSTASFMPIVFIVALALAFPDPSLGVDPYPSPLALPLTFPDPLLVFDSGELGDGELGEFELGD